jgi:hypothetical protein
VSVGRVSPSAYFLSAGLSASHLIVGLVARFTIARDGERGGGLMLGHPPSCIEVAGLLWIDQIGSSRTTSAAPIHRALSKKRNYSPTLILNQQT